MRFGETVIKIIENIEPSDMRLNFTIMSHRTGIPVSSLYSAWQNLIKAGSVRISIEIDHTVLIKKRQKGSISGIVGIPKNLRECDRMACSEKFVPRTKYQRFCHEHKGNGRRTMSKKFSKQK